MRRALIALGVVALAAEAFFSFTPGGESRELVVLARHEVDRGRRDVLGQHGDVA
ncbi:MAG TPA: hypothetical protein VF530_13420 [Planctomycetota bacterium]